jgi:hypothetical protein
MLLFTLSFLCLCAFAILFAILGAQENVLFLIIIELVIVFCCTAIAIAAVINIIYSTIPIMSAHLDVTEEGLEYDYSPVHHIRCRWEDIAAIKQRTEFIKYDIILLHRAEEIGKSKTMTIRRWFGLNPQYFITLNGLEGWPNGELKELLKQRVPQFFNN